LPYILKAKRTEIEKESRISYLIHYSIECAGDLNYVFTRMLREWIAKKGQSYQAYNDFIGAIECCKLEAYRRQIAPYEDKAIERNGDV
jgi:hypothetical protein